MGSSGFPDPPRSPPTREGHSFQNVPMKFQCLYMNRLLLEKCLEIMDFDLRWMHVRRTRSPGWQFWPSLPRGREGFPALQCESGKIFSILGFPVLEVVCTIAGKEKSNSHDARLVHQIISMIKWVWTSRLSIKNSFSVLPRTIAVKRKGNNLKGCIFFQLKLEKPCPAFGH